MIKIGKLVKNVRNFSLSFQQPFGSEIHEFVQSVWTKFKSRVGIYSRPHFVLRQSNLCFNTVVYKTPPYEKINKLASRSNITTQSGKRKSIDRKALWTPSSAGVTTSNKYFRTFKIITDKKKYFPLFSILIITFFTQNLYADEGPTLPEGLSGTKEQTTDDSPPGLPAGLGGASTSDSHNAQPEIPPGLGSSPPSDNSYDPGPSLPKGLFSENSKEKKENSKKETMTFPFTGFIEARGGMRLYDDPYEKDTSIGEIRLQLETEKQLGRFIVRNTTDFYYDAVPENHSIDLEKGEGFIDLRELSISFSAFDFMDIKAGRQILTWGTGDLVFINDLFPKDWQSFLAGRDTEYLKAPSDTLKASIFTDIVNIDIVYTPKFDPDRFITGERLSYWNGYRIAGRDNIVNANRPGDWFDNDEWAVRFSKNIKGNEFALYGYQGYWKSPGGIDEFTFRYIFPRLNVYGASFRGQVGRGIGNIEAGYYDSREDSSGDNPYINNSQFRFLVGYEQDLPRLAFGPDSRFSVLPRAHDGL